MAVSEQMEKVRPLERPSYSVLQVQRRLNPDELDELVTAYQAGATVRTLADQFRVHRTTVVRHLEMAGVPRRANTRKLTDEQIAKAAELYEAGWSTARIGERFKVDPETVRHWLGRAGVKIRPRRGMLLHANESPAPRPYGDSHLVLDTSSASLPP